MAGRHSSSGKDPYETLMCPGAPNALEGFPSYFFGWWWAGMRMMNSSKGGWAGEGGVKTEILLFHYPAYSRTAGQLVADRARGDRRYRHIDKTLIEIPTCYTLRKE